MAAEGKREAKNEKEGGGEIEASHGTPVNLLPFPAQILIDPSHFDIEDGKPRVHVLRRFFTDNLAKSVRTMALSLPGDCILMTSRKFTLMCANMSLTT